MTIKDRIASFEKLGLFLAQFKENKKLESLKELNELYFNDFEGLIESHYQYNSWFTTESIRNSISAIADSLEKKNIESFIEIYKSKIDSNKAKKNIGVVMAGNIPLVSFHDWFCVLLSGNKFIGKLSSDDKFLLPFINKVLVSIDSTFLNYVEFTEGQLKAIDAVIATGSNNSAKYFEYYFGKYPHIIRKNRNSVAVIDGTETLEDFKNLGKDIFQYYGLGCRSVSKLFVPKGYVFDIFFEAIIGFKEVINHNKYANNYDYNRTVYLMQNSSNLLDNNFLLLKEDSSYSSPIGVLFYEYYESIDELNNKFLSDKNQIQCIVSKNKNINNAIPFGAAQCPSLSEYADGVDTMEFLLNLE